MEAIRQAIFNSPTKKTNVVNQRSSTVLTSKNPSGIKAGPKSARTNAVDKKKLSGPASKMRLSGPASKMGVSGPASKMGVSGPTKVHPALRPPANAAAPSQNLKMLAPQVHTSAQAPIIKKKSLNLKTVVVPALYSLKELGLKKKNLREGIQKIETKNILKPTITTKESEKIVMRQKIQEPTALTKIHEIKTADHKSQIKIKPMHQLETKAQVKNQQKITPEPKQLKIEEKTKLQPKTTLVDDDDDDSDIEVEEINIVSKSEQPNSLQLEGGNSQSNLVISGIMKQVEELETTLKLNVAKKDGELQVERQIVEQLRRKNEILELRDKKRKEALEKRETEASKEIEKRNHEIETLQSFSASISQKLAQRQEEMETMKSFTKKNSDLMSQKLAQKQNEVSALNKKFGKMTTDLENLQKWKSAQAEKEKESLKKLIQGNLAKDLIYKQKIEALEKGNKVKDDLITNHEKAIESSEIKIADKDRLAKDLKLKVSKLITEFTKGFKDKDEQLKSKIQEIHESSSEIDQLKVRISVLDKNVLEKDKEIENKDLMNKRQASIIGDLSKKLDSFKAQNDQRENHEVTRQQEVDFRIESLEKRNAENMLITKQLQQKLSKLKTIQANGFTINNNDIFEDKLDEYIYTFYGTKQMNEPLMLTYSWPVLSVNVDPSFLKKQQKEDAKEPKISQFHVQVKPLMISYCWPLLPFVQKVKIYSIPCRGVKRKSSLTSSSKRSRLSEDTFHIPNVSLFQTIEQVTVLEDLTAFIDAPFYSFYKNRIVNRSNPSHNWPIVPFEQVNNRKRKSEDMVQSEVKIIKLDGELESQEDCAKEMTCEIIHDILDFVQFPGKHASEFVTTIIEEIMERSEKIVTKNWPVMIYRPKHDIKGRIQMDTLKRRNNITICNSKVSRQDILKVNISFQDKIPFFDIIPKLRMNSRKCSEQVYKTWPVMIYQEKNIIQKVLEIKVVEEVYDDKTKVEVLDERISDTETVKDLLEKSTSDDLDSSIELTLKDSLFDSKSLKRKCEEYPDFDNSKKTKLQDHLKNADEIMDEMLDYVVSFVDIKHLLI